MGLVCGACRDDFDEAEDKIGPRLDDLVKKEDDNILTPENDQQRTIKQEKDEVGTDFDYSEEQPEISRARGGALSFRTHVDARAPPDYSPDEIKIHPALLINIDAIKVEKNNKRSSRGRPPPLRSPPSRPPIPVNKVTGKQGSSGRPMSLSAPPKRPPPNIITLNTNDPNKSSRTTSQSASLNHPHPNPSSRPLPRTPDEKENLLLQNVKSSPLPSNNSSSIPHLPSRNPPNQNPTPPPLPPRSIKTGNLPPPLPNRPSSGSHSTPPSSYPRYASHSVSTTTSATSSNKSNFSASERPISSMINPNHPNRNI